MLQQRSPSIYRAVIENMFCVVDDATRETVPFALSETQAHLDSHWTRRNLITKVRQHAQISSYVIARFTAKCLAEQNRNCVIISHESRATERLLGRAKFILNNLRNTTSQVALGTDRNDAIVFKQTNSALWIGTAGQRSFGRGDTVSDLHLSEAAFYEDPERIRDGVFPAAEKGEITVESTGNGRGNWFHRAAQRARQGIGFNLFFYSWVGLRSCAIQLDPEAEARFAGTLNEDWEEQSLFAAGVTLAQLAWRRERILTDYDGDLVRFKENYPSKFEECFRAAGLSFFPVVKFVETAKWRQRSRCLWALDGHPAEGHKYAAGADVSGGVGQDQSVLQIFDIEAQEQVAEWASADYAPDEFGRECGRICTEFNKAYLNVERNNHGLTTISALTSCYPLDRLHRGTLHPPQNQVALTHIGSYGTYVSETTRGLLLGTARGVLTGWTIHSELLNDELSTFVENRTGKFEAAAGSYDDRVMAACHCFFALEQAAIMLSWEPRAPKTGPNPFQFDKEGQLLGLEADSILPRYTSGETNLNPYGVSDRFG